MANVRIILQATKPTARVELDTVDPSPANQILLLPDTNPTGLEVQFGMAVPSDSWSIPNSGNNGLRLTGTNGKVIDVNWGDLSSNTYTMTGYQVPLIHTYDTANHYTGDFSGDTNFITKIYSNNVPFWWQINSDLSALTSLFMYNDGNLAGSLADLASTLTVFDLFNIDGDSVTGSIASLPSGLTKFRFNSCGTNASITGSINDFATSSLTWLDITDATQVNGTISDLDTEQPNLTYLWLDSNNASLTGSISDLASTVQRIFIHNQAAVTGSINSLPSSAVYVDLKSLHTSNLTGSISGSLPSGLQDLRLYDLPAITGTISGTFPSSLTYLWLDSNNASLTGSISDLASTVQRIFIHNQAAVTGSINSLPSSAVYVDLKSLHTSNLTGSISGSLPSGLQDLRLYDLPAITGTISGTFPSSLTSLILQNLDLDGGDIAAVGNVTLLSIDNVTCTYTYTSKTWNNTMRLVQINPPATYGMSQSDIDDLIIDLSAANWSDQKTLILLGSNAAPSGSAPVLAALATLNSKGVTVNTN